MPGTQEVVLTLLVVGMPSFFIGLFAAWAIWSPYKKAAEGWKRDYEVAQANVERYQALLWKEEDEEEGDYWENQEKGPHIMD